MARFRFFLIVSLVVAVFSLSFGVTTIRYGVWMVEQMDGIKAQIAAFEKEHPDIKVKLEVVPWENYWTKLQTMLAGGNCWDVFAMDTGFYMEDYVIRGAVLDLTPYIERDHIDLSVYPKMVLAIHRFNGRYYSLPRDYDTIALYYNKDAFDKAGLKYPDESWTWTDVIYAAEKLTIRDKKGNVVQWGIVSDPGLEAVQQVVFPMMYSNGVEIIGKDGHMNIDVPQAVAVLRSIRDITKHGYAPKPLPNIQDYFISGKAAMMLEGSWMLGYYDKNIKSFKWGVAPFPPFGVRATISDSLGNVIWAKSKHKEAAWTFVKWLAGKEAAEILAKTGAVIPAYKGTADMWVKGFPKEHQKDAEVFIKSVAFTNPWPRALGESKWFDRLTSYYLFEIVSGRLDVEKGLKMATEEINRIIDQTKKRYSK